MNSIPNALAAPDAGVELERLGDEIAELSAHLDAATARLLDLIREFDARGGWNTGFLSCAQWLSWRVGLDRGAARERVRVARALGTLPRLAQALARGELSYSKVRALTRVATAETEERLLAVGRAGTAEHVERIVRGWRRVDRKAEAEETMRRHRNRALHCIKMKTAWSWSADGWSPKSAPCSFRRSPRLERTSTSGHARSKPRTFPRERRPWRSSRRTRSASSRRRRCITASIPAPRARATRWWSTSTRRS